MMNNRSFAKLSHGFLWKNLQRCGKNGNNVMMIHLQSRPTILSQVQFFSSSSSRTSSQMAEAQKKLEDLEKKLLSKDSSGPSKVPMTHQRYAGRKRFYKHVGVGETENGEFRVLLDGRTLRTPARNPLHFPTREIAMLAAGEWDAQTDERKGIEPVTMPIMTLASTAIDQIQFNDNNSLTSSGNDASKEFIVQNCLKYLPTDSLLFFTNDSDRILLKKQRKFLLPIIKTLNRHLHLNIEPTKAMTAKVQHSPETIAKIEQILNKMDHFSLACTQAITMECKSVLMAIAYYCQFVSTEQILFGSRIEEEFQVEIWGVVEGGHDMDRLNHSVAIHSATLFLNLLHFGKEDKIREIAGIHKPISRSDDHSDD